MATEPRDDNDPQSSAHTDETEARSQFAEAPELPRRAVLCAVQLPDVPDALFNESLEELTRLAKTLGLSVEGQVTQKRGSFDSGAYVGPGKLEELTAVVKGRSGPTVVLLDHEISPSQTRNIHKATGAYSVYDRTALILEIFHRHARTRQAKLQVELVRLQYLAPRLRETQKVGDRVRGGIGGKGAGESQLELDRRKIRDRIAQLRGEILELDSEHKTRSARRQGLRRVALCGYTNAGKSTLFHALTHSDVYIADKLFATLDTTVRQLMPEPRQKILVSDTVGFIRSLPTKLVASFKTTLEEALEAGLILHVVDCADPACLRHIETTNSVLAEIGAGEVPQLYVFNKIDKLEGGVLPTELAEKFPQHLTISAREPADVKRVRQAVIDYFDRELVEADAFMPYDQPHLRGLIFASAQVLGEEYEEAGTRFRVRLDPIALKQLARDVQVTAAKAESLTAGEPGSGEPPPSSAASPPSTSPPSSSSSPLGAGGTSLKE